MTDTKIISWQRGGQLAQSTPVVAVIGNFDGVHRGHQHLIETAKTLADDLALPLAILTFSPHPRAFFRPQDPPFLLMDEVQKNTVLSQYGADKIVHIRFDDALRVASPEEFVEEVLKPLHIVHLFAGADFAFGKGRAGTIETLTTLGHGFGMKTSAVTLAVDEHQIPLSSSRIRAALQAGQVELAEEMLGRPHKITGDVLQGDQRGRTIGFPTANIALTNQLHPAFGVYAIEAVIGTGDKAGSDPHGQQIRHLGVANIGVRPTVNDRGVLAEAHLFDFQEDIYGQRIEIALKGYVRAEMKFETLAALTAQIELDCKSAKDMLANK